MAEIFEPTTLERVQGVDVAVYGDDRGPKERRQHDRVETKLEYVGEQSRHIEGKVKRVTRTVDVLGRMLKANTITRAQAKAGRKFRDDFDRAKFDPLKAPALDRIPCENWSDVTLGSSEAKEAVRSVIDLLGGFDSPAANIVWDVLGCRLSIGQWSQKIRYDGTNLVGRQRVNSHRAAGILEAALGALAGHYGFTARS